MQAYSHICSFSRKRSLRGSFGNASDDTMVKSTTEEGKSQSDRILTRHRRRVSGLGRDDMDFVGLQFPKGSQRRRFRKTKRVVNDNQSPTENQNNDAQTTTNLSETVHNDYVKHLNKDIKKRRNDIFLKKAPGKRRRKRRPLIASSTSDAKVDGATFSKPKETFIKDNETTETPTTPLISSLDCDALNRDEHAENDDTVRENHEKFQSHERLSDDWRSCKYKKSNEQTSSLCDDSEVEEIINEKGDKQNEDGKAMFSGRLEELSQNKNDCTDISAKSSPHTDDNSCSAITSHDGDSIYSSECGSLKDRLSHNATDSDGGSITTSDRNLSLKHKHELGHHKTAIDFRVGGRLEARDYLNMWLSI